LVRKTAGDAVEAQVMAANVDTVLIMAALNQPLNTGRLERSLALVWDSGANPVVVLTKADLAEDLPRSIAEADDVAMGVPVLAISVMNGMGLDALDRMLQSGAAAALLGPSGVGKSTLLNYWLGETRQRVQAIRDEDGRGRHTTTHREIFRLANGALIVDIPGIREVGLWEGGTHQVFADIDALAGTCRFTDCQHDDEPGCAVQEAIDEGQLEQDRLVQYRKLERELAHLERKRSARARSEARQVWKQRSRDARQRNRVNKGRS
jgi:ribosome biogenesis GTPase